MITPAIIMTYFVLLLSTSLTFILFFIDHQKQVRALTKPDPAAAIVSVTLHMLYGLLLLVDLLWTVAVKKMLERRNAAVLPITEGITLQAISLMESLTLSHGLQMGDALIAATALEHRLPVLTGNVKHFTAVPGMLIEGFSV